MLFIYNNTGRERDSIRRNLQIEINRKLNIIVHKKNSFFEKSLDHPILIEKKPKEVFFRIN